MLRVLSLSMEILIVILVMTQSATTGKSSLRSEDGDNITLKEASNSFQEDDSKAVVRTNSHLMASPLSLHRGHRVIPSVSE